MCFISTQPCSFCSPADSPHFTTITVFPAGEVTEGGSVTLTCSTDAAPPAESFAWFKGRVLVFPKNRSSASVKLGFLCAVCFLFACNVNFQSTCVHICSPDMNSGSIPDSFRPQLHLSHLKYTDRGEYFCVARNSLGTDRSSPFLLNVTCESTGCFYRCCGDAGFCPTSYVHSQNAVEQRQLLFSDSPKNTQVLFSPPGDIREGSFVNLSCANKANPPANR